MPDRWRVDKRAQRHMRIIAFPHDRQKVVGPARDVSASRAAQSERDPAGQRGVGCDEGQRAGRFVAVEQHARRVFCLLHVRLVEWVDVQKRAGNRCRNFPADELCAERLRLCALIALSMCCTRLPARKTFRLCIP